MGLSLLFGLLASLLATFLDMSCLSWNCCGIGNQWTVQELIDMVRMERPNVVFLMETLVEESKLEQISS